MDSTITEQDMDLTTKQFVQGMGGDAADFEPDLCVDGLSESLVSRLMGLLGFRRSA